jgi:hypothetical protein
MKGIVWFGLDVWVPLLLQFSWQSIPLEWAVFFFFFFFFFNVHRNPWHQHEGKQSIPEHLNATNDVFSNGKQESCASYKPE